MSVLDAMPQDVAEDMSEFEWAKPCSCGNEADAVVWVSHCEHESGPLCNTTSYWCQECIDDFLPRLQLFLTWVRICGACSRHITSDLLENNFKSMPI